MTVVETMPKTPSAVRLRFTVAAWRLLEQHHRHDGPSERCSAAFGRLLQSDRGESVLVTERDIVLFADADYQWHLGAAVAIKPEAVRRLLWCFARSDAEALITIHDHWFDLGGTRFSMVDDHYDRQRDRYLRSTFAAMLGEAGFGPERQLRHLNLVFDQTSVDARQVDDRRRPAFVPVDTIHVPGHAHPVIVPNSAPRTPTNSRERQDFIRADTAAALHSLRVAIVGVGGLGPLVAENLARLGVGELILIDPDRLETSNLNRWLAGRPDQVGALKTDLLQQRLAVAVPDCSVRSVPASVLDADGQQALHGVDWIVGAVDCDAARMVLNRAACQQLLPYFDLAVLVRAHPLDFQTRLIPVFPGRSACLECSPLRVLDADRIQLALNPTLATAKRSAGYVVDEPAAAAPSVMALNTFIAGQAVLDMIGYLAGAGMINSEAEAAADISAAPTPLLTRWRSNQRVRLGVHAAEVNCPCCHGLLGRGASPPLPRRRSDEDLHKAILNLPDWPMSYTIG
ncbi:MAG: ThiF family adenylyltransferase [Xanthomonadales bacterium]|jgi:molybdopterin/thiamine biosynthesis adenylyltransferase|nr:ThiF family adenylyltransferase [Xanthomonadales bacterium]